VPAVDGDTVRGKAQDSPPIPRADRDQTLTLPPDCAGWAAYNRAMLHSLNALLAPALAERLTLLINHVLASEAVATDRLRPHSGRSLSLTLQGWPALLPQPPLLAWRITPAGLLDWSGTPGAAPAEGQEPDLAVTLQADNPALLLARTLGGEPPPVQVVGDAQLAGDVNWLLQNLRWDVAADLDRLFGPRLALPLHQVGRMLASALRKALQGASALGEQWRSRRA
jgi:ubiquinone biosynthesis accessory factor UbiJ